MVHKKKKKIPEFIYYLHKSIHTYELYKYTKLTDFL